MAYRRNHYQTAKDGVCIVVSRFGSIEQEEIDHVIRIVQECYNRLRPHDVSLVDLYLFTSSSSMEAFLTRECNEVGVLSAPFDELFFATHDAWRGIPRITLSLERMKPLPELVQVGGIRHEVGHSILHGSLRYYLLPLPQKLRELTKRFGLSTEYATNILYLISIAVKDYEVSRLLYERGYVEDLAAYAKHMMTTTIDDIISWEIAQRQPPAKVMWLIASLKAASCAIPLLDDKAYSGEIAQRLTKSVSHLPPNLYSLMLNMILEGFPALKTDTLGNINLMLDRCEVIFETILRK